MKVFSTRDSAPINAKLTQVATNMLSVALAKGFALPFIVEITDAQGEVVSCTISDDFDVTSHQDIRRFLIYPFGVVITDRAGQSIRMEIAQPEMTQ